VIPTSPLPLENLFEQKVAWIKNNQHLCRWPWSKEQISSFQKQPVSTPCCNAHIDFSDFGKNTDTKFAGIKADMLCGKLHDLCSVCTHNEQQGMTSERIQGLIDMPWSEINYLLQNHQETKNYFSIKFSNFCNLACRSCQPSDSTTYAQTYNLPVEMFDLSQDETSWKTITENIAKSASKKETIVNLLGGETTIQPGLYKFLDFIHEEKLSDRVKICFSSNMTAVTKNLLEKISQLETVMISASIDSVGENYHYVRWPANFAKVLDNFEQFVKLREHMSVLLILQPVFSINNIFYFGDYLDFWQDWFQQRNIQDIPIVNINLWSPTYLNLLNLTDPYRQHLHDYLKTYVDHPLLEKNANSNYLQIWLKQTLQSLAQPNLYNENFTEFLKKTAFFDKSTGTDFEFYNSRLYNLLTSSDKERFMKYKSVT